MGILNILQEVADDLAIPRDDYYGEYTLENEIQDTIDNHRMAMNIADGVQLDNGSRDWYDTLVELGAQTEEGRAVINTGTAVIEVLNAFDDILHSIF